MLSLQRLLTKMPRQGSLCAISTRSKEGQIVRPSRKVMDKNKNRLYTQKVEAMRQRPTSLESMREFFEHPMTWDRNNGYLNVLLCLAIFGFCFINSCSPAKSKNIRNDRRD